MKKSIALLTALSILAQACAQSASTTQQPDPVAADVEEVARLLKGPNPNFALAEIVAREIAQRSPEKVPQIRAQAKLAIDSSLESMDYPGFINRAQTRHLLAGSAVGQDPEYWENSMAVQVAEMAAAGSFTERVNVSITGLVKSAAYDRLMTAYRSEIASGAKAVARQVVKELEEKKPDAIKEIDLARNLLPPERAAEIQKRLLEHDEILSRYYMTKDDQIRVLFVGYVASEMAEVLKEHPTVKEILRIKGEVDTAIEKAKTVQALMISIRDSHKEIAGNLKEMKSAFTGLVGDFKETWEKAKNAPDEASRKQAKQFLIDMAKGEPRKPIVGPPGASAITGPQEVSPNLTRFMKSANKAAGSLDTIVNATEKIAETIGIKIDPGLKKVIDTTRKISAGVKLANSVITGFAAGGPVGALAAFAGSGLADSILGGGGADSNAAVMQELAEIKADIAEIKQTTKQILELQRETIKMIRDLAVMIDEYHRQEMFELAEIKKELVTLEGMSTYVMNQKISNCNTILTFVASQDPGAKPVIQMNLADVVFDWGALSAKAGGLNGIREAMSVADWTQCRSGFNEYFGNTKREVAPFHERYNVAREIENGRLVEDHLLVPALQFLAAQKVAPDFKDLALHLPVANVKTLYLRKEPHIYSKVFNSNESQKLKGDLYPLVSPAALEQWTSHLLPLFPYVSFGDDVTSILKDLPAGRGNRNAVKTATINSRNWLVSALELAQLAIAQQAVLAGEPMLTKLHDNWLAIINTRANCTGNADVGSYCFVWKNNLMMNNLVSYRLHRYQGAEAVKRYAASVEVDGSGHQVVVAEALGIKPERLKYSTERKRWLLLPPEGSNDIDGLVLPAGKLVESGFIQYGESLPRLNRLAQRLAQELALVGPNSLSDQQAKTLALVLMSR